MDKMLLSQLMDCFHVANTTGLRSAIIIRNLNRINRWDATSVIYVNCINGWDATSVIYWQISIMRLLHFNICHRITNPFQRYLQYVFVKCYYATKYLMKSLFSINKLLVNVYIDLRPFALDNWYSSNILSIHQSINQVVGKSILTDSTLMHEKCLIIKTHSIKLSFLISQDQVTIYQQCCLAHRVIANEHICRLIDQC